MPPTSRLTPPGWHRRASHWDAVTGDDLDRYREHSRVRLPGRLRTAGWSSSARCTARRRGRYLVPFDPASRLRGVRGRDERDGGALTRQQARELLEAIAGDLERPGHDLLACRDLALVSILLRTGIRRSELASLRVSSLGKAQGHHILTLTGKGNVRRTAKAPPDVWRLIEDWLAAATGGRHRARRRRPTIRRGSPRWPRPWAEPDQ